MTAQKQGEAPASSKSQPSNAATSARKSWIRRGPVEIVLEQIGKQERKVNEMREDLKKEERELQKLQQAKKVLEAV